jgi:hypothetical protein
MIPDLYKNICPHTSPYQPVNHHYIMNVGQIAKQFFDLPKLALNWSMECFSIPCSIYH